MASEAAIRKSLRGNWGSGQIDEFDKMIEKVLAVLKPKAATWAT
jgi:hypothetical protein